MKHLFSGGVLSVLDLSRITKRLIALSVDICSCTLAVWFAYYLRVGDFIALSGSALLPVVVSITIALPIFVYFGFYRAIFRYSGWPALITVARAIAIYGLMFFVIFTVYGVHGVPRTVGIIQPMLLLIFVGSSRAIVRIFLGEDYRRILKKSLRPKVLIYGAGAPGRQLVGAIESSQEMQGVGFLDDDKRLHGHLLNGQPVYDPSELPDLVLTFPLRYVLLAMPSISRKRRNEILGQMREARVALRTLPNINDLAQGKVSVTDLQELDIEDLLGRERIMPDHALLALNVRLKVVMVTGAGGSIGSELCRQILEVSPSKLLLIEQSEFALYAIHQELQQKLGGRSTAIIPLLGSIQDSDRIREILSTWNPDTLYHAAAYKHVPLVEHNPVEGIKNNVLGTLKLVQASLDSRVSNFVLVSTDKAVRPTNIMGASKRLAEMILQAFAATPSITKFSMVRFGNVLNSSGSVVPKFREQIREGGPITLTHMHITRYFMTIPEAAQLVIQAGAMAKGGDVFVLDMGEQVKIADLARRMIELSGMTVKEERHPNGEMEIRVIGLRPGEKLYEELLLGDDPQPTTHPRIMKASDHFVPLKDLLEILNTLEMAITTFDIQLIRQILEKTVSGYSSQDNIVDWVYLEQDD